MYFWRTSSSGFITNHLFLEERKSLYRCFFFEYPCAESYKWMFNYRHDLIFVHIICYYIPFRCWKVCCYCGSVFQEDTCPNSRWWHRYLASAPYFQKCIVPLGLMQIAYGKLCLEEAQRGFWGRNSAESVKKRGKVRVHEKKFVSSHHV